MNFGGVLRRSFILVVFGAAGSDAHSEPMTEMAAFARCYAQLTGQRVTLQHPLRVSVKNGTMTARQACLSILEKARLQASGPNAGKILNPADAEAVSVINHMNDFHRSWFVSDNLEGALIDTNNALRRDRQVHDETEGALFMTRALFGTNIQYREVVTQSSALEAQRSSGPQTEPTWDGVRGWSNSANEMFGGKVIPQKFKGLSMPIESGCTSCSSNSNSSAINAAGESAKPVLNLQTIQTGDLIGVTRVADNAAKNTVQSHSKQGMGISYHLPLAYPFYYFNLPIKIHESLGAGIIGTKSYLLLNLGRPNNTYSDGGVELPRRWAKSVVSDLLCREIPVLRDSDVGLYVQGNSKLPFRNSRQCMKCHATIDTMAAIARNVSVRPFPELDFSQWSSSGQLAVHPVEAPPLTSWVDLDRDYYKRPPNGTLYFRSYSGERVMVPIDGNASASAAFSKLGLALANTNDLYVCAASRYFQKFTGIKANLQDIGDTSRPALSARDLELRNEVIQLGLNLKQHQSLTTLIDQILSSPRFKDTSPADAGGAP